MPDRAQHSLEIVPQHPIPAQLVADIQSKLAYVDEMILTAHVSGESQLIRLGLNQQPDAARRAALEEKVHRVVASMVKGAIAPKVQVLEDYLDRPVPYREDPLPALQVQGEVSREADGIYALGPLVAWLIEDFEKRLLDLAASFGAAPYRFPALIPARYLERVNYFRAFPHSLTFATHLRTDLEAIDHFAQQATCRPDGSLDIPSGDFAAIQALLSPAVCYHLYFSLADQSLADGRLTATAVGDCFRYEAINLNSLERMWNFTMREVIFVGQKDFVLENRELARQRMQPILEELGLAYRVESANDPFFIGEFRRQAAYQSAFQLKYEIRALLPYNQDTLAVGSYNYHQDFFGRHLNISLPDGSPAHTGCVAFGLERLAYAFLAQYGPQPGDWPTTLREAFDER